jgi:hypothetical protein
MYNAAVVSPMGPSLGGEELQLVVGAHAHFGVLGILAIVLGFAVDQYGVDGTRRTAVTGLFLAVQWLLPATVLGMAFVTPMLGMLNYLFGVLLFVAMILMAWIVWTEDPSAI